MLKKSFIVSAPPRLQYDLLESIPTEPQDVPLPRKVILMLEETSARGGTVSVKAGDRVKTGQRIGYAEADAPSHLCPVTGTVLSVSRTIGDFGRIDVAVAIETSETEEEETPVSAENLTLEAAVEFLSFLPGELPLHKFVHPDHPIDTIIVAGVDGDLGIVTEQYTVKTQMKLVARGLAMLKRLTGVPNLILAVPRELVQGYAPMEAQVMPVDREYPSALPHLLCRDLTNRVIPAGRTSESVGVTFISAEGVASLGRFLEKGAIPNHKIVTLLGKDGQRHLLRCRIGTPVRALSDALGEDLKEGDRIVFGGPMTGRAGYSEEEPVRSDTDALVFQDASVLAEISDYPCINCGECIRACPAEMPVSMLVRFLEVGHYEEGSESYDLYSCISCGLCSYVCPSHIPIFQYIRLAKYELERIHGAEAANA